MANGSEGALDRVCGSDVLSVLGREVVEGQEDITVFCQPSNGLVEFHAVGGHEIIKSCVSIHACLCVPNVVQMALCFGLNRFWHRVQHIAGLVEPTALFFRGAINLAQCNPKPRAPRTFSPDVDNGFAVRDTKIHLCNETKYRFYCSDNTIRYPIDISVFFFHHRLTAVFFYTPIGHSGIAKDSPIHACEN